jgi:hypothetical protein
MGFFKKLFGKNKSVPPTTNPNAPTSSGIVVDLHVTNADVEEIIHHDFPADQYQKVLKLLNGFRYSEGFREVAQKMILEEAKGNIEKVKKYVEIADQVHGDFRDLASSLESLRPKPCDGKNHHPCNGKVSQNWDSKTGETLWVCLRCGEKYEHQRLIENNLFTQSQVYAVCNCEFCGTCGQKFLPSGSCPCIHTS